MDKITKVTNAGNVFTVDFEKGNTTVTVAVKDDVMATICIPTRDILEVAETFYKYVGVSVKKETCVNHGIRPKHGATKRRG